MKKLDSSIVMMIISGAELTAKFSIVRLRVGLA